MHLTLTCPQGEARQPRLLAQTHVRVDAGEGGVTREKIRVMRVQGLALAQARYEEQRAPRGGTILGREFVSRLVLGKVRIRQQGWGRGWRNAGTGSGTG